MILMSKFFNLGMRREAVQEERQRNKEKNENEVESSTTMCSMNNSNSSNGNFQLDISTEKILSVESKIEQRLHELTQDNHNFSSLLFANNLIDDNNNNNFNSRYQLECYQLIEWSKEVPYFSKLTIEDRIALLKSAWNELIIAAFSHRLN